MVSTMQTRPDEERSTGGQTQICRPQDPDQPDQAKIEADLDRANELAAEVTGVADAVDLALERAAETLAAAAVDRWTPAAEVQIAAPRAEIETDDFMADPYDFSPGDQAWMTGG